MRFAQEADVLHTVISATSKRFAVVKLESTLFGASATAGVYKTALVLVACADSSPDCSRDIA